ncbi:hypothetical protein [Microcystis aeruginosa]|uniref:hypothetical protein n=1 Tax=Microcystis aeruginosa TaxID=1126 RepID=UPI000776A945|nr:hypothetical protein [Microcystis aeruginosa]KXS88857.1 hypothetical protein OA58_24715 [Microcystis aeruginosa NIES-88]BCU14752.1 hypothetical protein MAN88_53160 [Microcystis aeruginosa]
MNSNNWYHSHSFNFRGLTWEFTYIEATASRTIEAIKPDGTKIHLKIPIKETTKFAYPLAWLEKWEQSKGKRILLRDKAEPRTLFEMQLTPSKLPHDETEKTLLGVNGNEPASMEELTPSKSPHDETEKTLLGVNENKQEMELTPSKCLSCSLCQRISSILLTCLASPKYFTEETAKECDRFTPIAPKTQPEGNLEEIPKRPRRRRGTGSGTFITTYANHGKYGKKYPQISYQVEFGGKKRSIYVIAEKIEQIQELDRLGKPINEILEAIDSPKAGKVLKEYKDFLESKEEEN